MTGPTGSAVLATQVLATLLILLDQLFAKYFQAQIS